MIVFLVQDRGVCYVMVDVSEEITAFNFRLQFIALVTETLQCSETSTYIYQNTRWYISENSHRYTPSRGNLKSHDH